MITDFSTPSSADEYRKQANMLERKELFDAAKRMYLAAGDDEKARECELKDLKLKENTINSTGETENQFQ